MEQIIAWFDAYRIDHKVSYVGGVPALVSPIGNLNVSIKGNHCRVNGRPVSRKFVKALKAYYA